MSDLATPLAGQMVAARTASLLLRDAVNRAPHANQSSDANAFWDSIARAQHQRVDQGRTPIKHPTDRTHRLSATPTNPGREHELHAADARSERTFRGKR